VLLGKVKALLDKDHWRIGNVDVMILAEAPKLKDYMDGMTRNIASVLSLAASDVSLKAGTNEKLGFVGRGNIVVEAIALSSPP
jgi:2-C-methyl-D-erythritol 2,4-cyclodiphosphate synthase